MFFATQNLVRAVLILSVALMAQFTRPVKAQSTAIVTPVAYGQSSYGMLQAGDGNFYAPSPPSFQSCNNSTTQLCSYIYSMTPDGTTSIFYSFEPISNSASPNNLDGIEPTALFVGTDGALYGACMAGGPGGFGTIFKIDIPTKTLTVLKSFGVTGNTVDLGNSPNSLIQAADGSFYFTNGVGIYQLTVSGTTGTVTTLYTFPYNAITDLLANGYGSNSLVQGSDGNLYMTMATGPQTAPGGGAQGAIGQFNPVALVFSPIFSFPSDGTLGNQPMGPLTEGPGGYLYGVTQFSANNAQTAGFGFAVTFGGGFSTVHRFTDRVGQFNGAMILGSDGNLYGTTALGGDTASTNCTPIGCGTLFQMTTNSGFTTLHQFEGGAPDPTNPPNPPIVDGASPTTTLVQAGDGSFYGTQFGNGKSVPIVYKASLTPTAPAPIQLTLNPAEVIPDHPTTLTWQVLNGYSLTAEQCGASVKGNSAGATSAGEWTGKQPGMMSGEIYSGTATITPTANGIFTYALTCGGKETGFVTLTARDNSLISIVAPDAIQLSATVSQKYSLTLTAIGGKSPYTWSIDSGSLPDGLTLDDSNGIVSGTPLQFGKYPFVVKVTDSSPAPIETSLSITITVDSGLKLFQNLVNPVVGAAYSDSLASSTQGGLPPYTWQLTQGKLPTGLQLTTSTGVISGTSTVAGSFSFTITVSDSENMPDQKQVLFTLVVAGPLQVNTTSPLPPASVGVPYSLKLEAAGGVAPYTWTLGANGAPPLNVPPGLSLSSNGTISGKPTQYTSPVGTENTFNVIVSDSSTPMLTAPAALSIAVLSTLQVTTSTLPNGTVGVVTDVPLTATGGVPPYTWSVSAAPNPNIGIQVVTGNVLEYDPVVAMTSIITLTVKDSENTAAQAFAYPELITLPAPTVTMTTLTSSNTAAAVGEIVTLTAAVTPLAGSTPTGQVIFSNGTATQGTAALDANGKAALQTSFATAGLISITASYSGNGVDAASVSTPLTEIIVTPGVTAAVSPVSLSVQQGSSGQLIITVTPIGGFTGKITFTCGTLPKHVSCTFAPASLTISGPGPVTDILTVSTKGPLKAALEKPSIPPDSGGTHNGPLTATSFWLPGSLTAVLGLVRRKRRGSFRHKRNLWMIAILLLGGVGAISSCGGTSDVSRPGTYTIPIELNLSGGATQDISATVVVE